MEPTEGVEQRPNASPARKGCIFVDVRVYLTTIPRALDHPAAGEGAGASSFVGIMPRVEIPVVNGAREAFVGHLDEEALAGCAAATTTATPQRTSASARSVRCA